MIYSLKCGTVYSPDSAFCHSSFIPILHINTHCKDTVPVMCLQSYLPQTNLSPQKSTSVATDAWWTVRITKWVLSHLSTNHRIISEIVFNSILCNGKVFLYLLPKLWPLEPKVAAAKGWLCEPGEAFAAGSWSGSGVINFVPPGLSSWLDKASSRQLLLALFCP